MHDNSLKQCRGSMTFWCGPGSPDPYLWETDPDPSRYPTLFFSDFKDGQKKIFIYFLITYWYAQIHCLQCWKFNFLLKFCVKILFCMHYFSSLNTFMRKGKDPDPNPDPDPDPYLWLMHPDLGGPKKPCGSGSGSQHWSKDTTKTA